MLLRRIRGAGQYGSTYSQSSAHCWGETYTYDQWANMSAISSLSSSYTGCTQDNLSVSVTTNNQLSSTGFSYDAAGNMTGDNTYTYGYDAESQIKSAAGVNYTYDGDGNRLEKSSGKIYWYGAGTEILDESTSSGTFTNEYVFFGGRRIAMRNVSTGTIYYYEDDMLGSSRTMVQAGQTSPCFDADFLPFGYEKDVTTTCTQNYKFEGKERDTETNNDDFGARYYTFRLGRWLSADWSSVPAPVPYANLTNPQTLNLYSMVSDNPESFADLTGHDSAASSGSGSGWCSGDSCSGFADSNCDHPDAAIGACYAAAAAEVFHDATTEDSNGQSDPATDQQAATQLSVADVVKIIQQAQKSGSDPVTTGMQIFTGLGDNVSVTGDTLRQAIKETKVDVGGAAADLIQHADSISKSGAAVTITSKSDYTTTQDGNRLHIDKKVSFNVATEGGLPALTGIKGLHVDTEKHSGVSINRIAVAMHAFAEKSPPVRALAITGSKFGFSDTQYFPIQ